MHSGEPKDHEVCAQDDRRLIFSHVLTPWATFCRRSAAVAPLFAVVLPILLGGHFRAVDLFIAR